MTYYQTPPTKRTRGRSVLRFIAGAIMSLFILFVGILIGSVTASAPTPAATFGEAVATSAPAVRLTSPVTTSSTTTPSRSPRPTKAAPVVHAIPSDTLVHVGEDVPAGVYRVETNVPGGCYWQKSSDAEGQAILANDIVTGGRPQVTLKSGQWFTSERCGAWIKK